MDEQHDHDGDDHSRSTIITRRLVLKTPSDDERGAIVALAADPGIAGNLAAAPGDYGRLGGRSFVVVGRAGRAVVGVTGFGPMIDRNGAVEIATWIGEPYWGRGYATEASQAVIDAAFGETGVSALWCSKRVTNDRARRVIEKCGFQFRETGMVRSPVTMGAVPVERFVLERRNWISLKSWGAAMAGESDAAHNGPI
ncbi:GNAT family N-acetyltransferase [Bauldia sp.]|uniref:GNAT family N-acetyltransferase n=1 Tax=Bauldia sp. TaxID=2575872 RepID=UPI003BA8DCD4